MSLNDRPGLLLTPSRGFGGGIERVASAIEEALPGVGRVDLYDVRRHAEARANRNAKAQFSARAIREATRPRAGYVLCLHAGLLPAAAMAAAAARAPLFAFAIGTEVWAPMPALTRRLLASCRGVLAISRFTADWTARRAGVDRSRVQVLHLPIARMLVDGAALARARTNGGPTLLTVSRVVREHRYKGHFEIARALPEVLQACPHARWDVVGTGDDLPALRAHCAELGIADHVTFSGAVDEAALAERYRAAAALVLPSVADATTVPPTGEGFGLVYAEAGAFGVPSIASTEGGGALDFVRHDRTGLLVAPGASGDLAAAMIALLEDAGRRTRLGDEARSLAHERHLPEHFAAALSQALR